MLLKKLAQSSKVRKKKPNFKSKFEGVIAEQLKELGIPIQYEVSKIEYIIPETKHKYCPDFKVTDTVFIEAKGKFDSSERRKYVLLKEQNPDIMIHIVFQNANQKIRKGSKTTYGMWCDKNGLSWSHKKVKTEWLQ